MAKPENYGSIRPEKYIPTDWYQEYIEECERRPNSAERLISCLRGADITPMRTAAINDFLRDVAVLIDERSGRAESFTA